MVSTHNDQSGDGSASGTVNDRTTTTTDQETELFDAEHPMEQPETMDIDDKNKNNTNDIINQAPTSSTMTSEDEPAAVSTKDEPTKTSSSFFHSTTTRPSNLSPEELQHLLSITNYTEQEIRQFYQYTTDSSSSSPFISKQTFSKICLEHGIRNTALIQRLWTVLDINANGQLEPKELCLGLHPLLRGTRTQLAVFFFQLYELDGDGRVSAAELAAVYSDLVHVNATHTETHLTTDQKQRLVQFLQASNQRGLTQEEFVQAIEEQYERQQQQQQQQLQDKDGKDTDPTSSFCSFRTCYYIFWTAWFEMGTSFALPAMGALSERIKDRFDTTDAGIGVLTAAYYGAAMVGPLIGGVAMDRVGPSKVILVANTLVAIGALCQALADGPDQFALLLIGRLLLGLGGEVTPFTTVEILGRLFPDYFGLMAGVRNLIQSTSGFLAFVLLPLWADTYSNSDIDNNDGTTFALMMCFALACVSLMACLVVHFSMQWEASTLEKANHAAKAETQSDQQTISNTLRAFAKATAPQPPSGCAKWKLPLAFYLACVGIKAQYFAPFGFTAFSNEIYRSKFDQSERNASFQTGVISLVAGLMGPPMGFLSDKYGQRSPSLAVASLLAMIGFAVLAVATGGSAAVWVATMLFALQYGFGDTVAYISIRFIVGISRAGVGYGIYGVLGNLIATVVPIVGGLLLDLESGGEEYVCWYFAGLMFIGAACWVLVRVLEGPRSLLELPADRIIETSDEDIQLAALSFVIDPPHKKSAGEVLNAPSKNVVSKK